MPDWKPVPGHLMTRWAATLDPGAPLPGYPRPQLVRPEWQNLNGIWEYAVTAREAPQPEGFGGEILVPFAIETALSGVRSYYWAEGALEIMRVIVARELLGKEYVATR